MPTIKDVVAIAELKIRAHLDSWKSPHESRRQWDQITFKLSSERKLSATVERFSAGLHQIRIGKSFASQLVKMSREPWGGSSNMPKRERDWKIEQTSCYAMLLVYYHELAHVVRGHLYELAVRDQTTGPQFSWDESASSPPKNCIRLCRWIERDADVVGSDLFATFTALPNWRKKSKTVRKTMAHLCLVAAATVCLVIEDRRQKSICTIHDAPYLRWLTYVDSLGGALARELRLSGDDWFGIVESVLVDLQQIAANREIPEKIWALEDIDAFRKVTRRHTANVDSYFRFEEKYLGDRSSFLPDVKPDFATTKRAVESTVRSLGKRSTSTSGETNGKKTIETQKG